MPEVVCSDCGFDTYDYRHRAHMNRHGHPRFYELLDEAADIHDAKNRDYTGNHSPLWNFEFVAQHMKDVYPRADVAPAVKVSMTLILVKVARILALLETGTKPKNESLSDSLTDLGIYSFITRILQEEHGT